MKSQCLVADVLDLFTESMKLNRYDRAETTTNVTFGLFVLTDNLIKQFHCPDIQFSKRGSSYFKNNRKLSHFYSCSLSMHVFLFTPTPKLPV